MRTGRRDRVDRRRSDQHSAARLRADQDSAAILDVCPVQRKGAGTREQYNLPVEGKTTKGELLQLVRSSPVGRLDQRELSLAR